MFCVKSTAPRVLLFMAVSVFGLLSGCGSDQPKDLTDEQALGLFGSSSFPEILKDAPHTITQAVDDCLAVVSGFNNGANLADVPADMASQMKTACANRLKVMLDNKEKNKYGVTMEMVENPEFVARIHAVKLDADKRASAYNDAIYQVVAKSQAEKEKVAQEKAINDLASYRADYADFLSALEDNYNNIMSLCDEWSDYALKIQNDPSLKTSYKLQKALVCTMSYDDVRMLGENNLSKIDMLKIERNGMEWYFDKPLTDAMPVTRGWFDAQTKLLNEEIGNMREALNK